MAPLPPPTSPPPSARSPPPPTSPLPTATRKSSLQYRNSRPAQPSLITQKQRAQSPAGSVASSSSALPLSYRSNPSISSLFASTSGLSYGAKGSGRSTPSRDGAMSGSTLLSPISAAQSGGDGRVVSPMSSTVVLGSDAGRIRSSGGKVVRDLIQCAFGPHIGVIASDDVEEMLGARGFGKSNSDGAGAFLDLIRPLGERISGRVTIRENSTGSSRSYEDYGVRFFGMGKSAGAQEQGMPNGNSSRRDNLWREPSEGDISQIEEVVDRHLAFAELRPSSMHDLSGQHDEVEEHEHDQGGGGRSDIMSSPSTAVPAHYQTTSQSAVSPFYTLFLRRLLSGHPLSSHETFTHPVACIIVISSRNPSPIEEFKKLYESTNVGNQSGRLPTWVNNDFLRYYVLVHDDDGGDIQKSTQLYEQMKRHFGLHCHLLRLRSQQCLPSDDDSVRLPQRDWMSAGEELANIQNRELNDDDEDPTPCLFESDITSLQAFIRELVTQSVVPSMERLCAQWNDSVANKRRGISGRIMSMSKRWTPFGGASTNNSRTTTGAGSGSSNYDSVQGTYRPDSAEALMRKLADYAFMLRDYKLASSTYELLRGDNEHDKAWKHYAGANEMCLISTLLYNGSRATFQSTERWLEAAVHSYIHRCATPFYALRTLLLAAECLKFRGSLGVDEPARWLGRVLETQGLIGKIGGALVMERIAGFYASKPSIMQGIGIGSRRRKTGFWWLMSAEGWVQVGKSVQAERCLEEAVATLSISLPEKSGEKGAAQAGPPAWMAGVLQGLREKIMTLKLDAMGDLNASYYDDGGEGMLHDEEITEEVLAPRLHRRGTLGEGGGRLQADSGIDAAPLSPVRTRDSEIQGDDGFE